MAADLLPLLNLAARRRAVPELFKAAFSPSPAVEQAVLAQAQGPPPGADPSQGGAPPGMGAPPGAGAPPGMGGAPPGADPSQGAPPGAGAPPGDGAVEPPGGPQDPTAAKLDQVLQLLQNSQGGAGGQPGKPATMPIKVEPAHWKQFVDQFAHLKAIVMAMADAQGIQVPASTLLASATQMPGQEQPAPAAGGAPSAGGASPGGGPPPSQIAQALPPLPSVAAKAAADALVRLHAGTPVGRDDGAPPNKAVRLQSLVAAAHRRRAS